MCNIWSLVGCIVDYTYITARKVAVACSVYTYNRSSPIDNFSEEKLPNLRTIIVIADIDRGLYSPAKQITPLHPPYLTFRHWSGVTLYTWTYVFAESCVFVKQLPGNLSLRPQRIATQGRPYPEVTAAFLPSSLRTPHSFALVFSTLPPVSVCGTESLRLSLEVFLESVLPSFARP